MWVTHHERSTSRAQPAAFPRVLSAMGLGSTLLPEALTFAAQDADIVTIDILKPSELTELHVKHPML